MIVCAYDCIYMYDCASVYMIVCVCVYDCEHVYVCVCVCIHHQGEQITS